MALREELSGAGAKARLGGRGRGGSRELPQEPGGWGCTRAALCRESARCGGSRKPDVAGAEAIAHVAFGSKTEALIMTGQNFPLVGCSPRAGRMIARP